MKEDENGQNDTHEQIADAKLLALLFAQQGFIKILSKHIVTELQKTLTSDEQTRK